MCCATVIESKTDRQVSVRSAMELVIPALYSIHKGFAARPGIGNAGTLPDRVTRPFTDISWSARSAVSSLNGFYRHAICWGGDVEQFLNQIE